MSPFLSWALTNAVVVGLLALAVTLLSRVVQRPALIRTLWLLVLIKLVTPSPWTWRVPVFEPTAGEVMVAPDAATAGLGALLVDAREGAQPSTVVADVMSMVPPTDRRPVLAPVTANAADSSTPAWWRRVPWDQLALMVWALGAVALALLIAMRARRCGRLVRAAESGDASLQRLAMDVAKSFGLQSAPDVRVVHARISPFLGSTGGRSVIVMPEALRVSLTPEQLRTILAHEMAHFRRLDHWVRRFELTVTVLYWWHPVVWWARRRAHHAAELCCDAEVRARFPKQRREYARALLEVTDFLSRSPALAAPRGVAAIGSELSLRWRLEMLLQGSESPRLSWPSRIALGLMAGAVLPSSVSLWAQDEQDEAKEVSARRVVEVQEESVEETRQLDAIRERIRAMEAERARLEAQVHAQRAEGEANAAAKQALDAARVLQSSAAMGHANEMAVQAARAAQEAAQVDMRDALEAQQQSVAALEAMRAERQAHAAHALAHGQAAAELARVAALEQVEHAKHQFDVEALQESLHAQRAQLHEHVAGLAQAAQQHAWSEQVQQQVQQQLRSQLEQAHANLQAQEEMLSGQLEAIVQGQLRAVQEMHGGQHEHDGDHAHAEGGCCQEDEAHEQDDGNVQLQQKVQDLLAAQRRPIERVQAIMAQDQANQAVRARDESQRRVREGQARLREGQERRREAQERLRRGQSRAEEGRRSLQDGQRKMLEAQRRVAEAQQRAAEAAKRGEEARARGQQRAAEAAQRGAEMRAQAERRAAESAARMKAQRAQAAERAERSRNEPRQAQPRTERRSAETRERAQAESAPVQEHHHTHQHNHVHHHHGADGGGDAALKARIQELEAALEALQGELEKTKAPKAERRRDIAHR